MKTSSNKRFLSLLLALAMILSVMPLSVLAVEYLNTTVLNGKIQVSTDGVSGQGSAVLNDDGTITVVTTATSKCAGLGSYNYTANAHTVLVKNVTTDETLMVDFDYAATGLGALTVDGVNKTATPSGNASKSLAPGESIEIVITSPATGSGSTGSSATIVLSDFQLMDTGSRTVTVMKMDGGTTTVNGTTLSNASTTVTTDYATGVTVTAAPASGYVFLGWVDADMNVLSTQKTHLVQPLGNITVAAAFVPSDTQAYWLANNRFFTDLNEACAAAANGDKTVILLKSATLASGTYTIPAGISVLIPYDEAKTSYGPEPELMPNKTAWVTPSPFMTLTMASGANLVVDGTLELAAKHHVSTGVDSIRWGGAIYGKFGHIKMNTNSTIEVNGTLYAWGIVSGSGEVIANSGGTIHEKMQINDYRGGTATTSLVMAYASKKLFPFSQYYVQNVEVKETIHSGASLIVNAGVFLSTPEQASVAFVGNQGAMFTMAEGSYVTKQYNAAEDRLQIDVYGNTTLSSISLGFNGQNVNSADFRLGINNNIDINVHSGVTTISQEMVLQSGATVTVDREASLYNTTNVFVMDAEDWGNYARGHLLLPVKWSYANGTTVKRESVTDAIVDINGSVINGGQVFSSGSESVISSEKTGVYALLTPATGSATTSQLDHNSFTMGTTSDWVTISYTSAVLVHGDGTTLTAEGAQYDAYIYDSFLDKWVQKNIYNGGAGYTATVTYDANGGTGTTAATTVDYLGTAMAFLNSGYTAIAPFSFALPQNGFTHPAGTFIGWSTDPNATEAQYAPGDYVAASADTTVYAVWDVESFTLTVDGVSKDMDYGADLSTYITAPTKDGFKFTGWTVTKTDGTVVDEPATMPAYDVIFTSNWEKISTYTLTFLDPEGNVYATGEYEAGASITAPEYSLEGYTFNGWINTATGAVETVPAVMPGNALEYQASVEIITYTISFIDGTTEVGEVTVEYGQKATLLDALTDATRVFQGWGTTADAVTYAAGATIDVSGNMDLYAVWHTHTEETVPGKDATCTETGLTDGVKCSVCGEILTAQEEIPMAAHTEETIPGKDATCTETGLTDGVKCSVCGEILTAQVEIPANDHNFVNGGCTNCDAEIQVSLPGSFNGWDTSAWIMTRDEAGIYTYQIHLDAGTDTFKVMDDGNWLGNNGTISDDTDGYEWIFGDGGDCTLSASGGTYTFIYNINTKGLKVEVVLDHVHDYDVTFNWSDYYTTCTASGSCSCGDSISESCTIQKTLEGDKLSFTAECNGKSDTVTVDADTTNVIYVDVSAMGWTNVNAYCWNRTTGEKMATWPGTAMTHVSGSVYSIIVPDTYDMIVFNNGSAQTEDEYNPVKGENIAVVKSSNTTDWGYMEPATYSITFTDEPGYEMVQWSYTITKPYGAPITEEDKAALEASIPTVENYYIDRWYLPDYASAEIPETMPNYDQTFYAFWRGVESFVTFYSDPSMSEESFLFVSCFRYGEYYDDLESFVIVNRLDEETPADHHVAAIKYADGTEMQFPYTHGTEGFSLYVVFERNACEVHTEKTIPGYAADCVNPGLTDGVKCSVCGETLVAQEEIPALGHTEEAVSGYDATCTENGLTDGSKCSVCGETVTAQEIIPAKGHSYVDGICSVCGNEQYMTIYFQNNWLWSDVKLYFWGSETDPNPEWEGLRMDYYDNDGTYDYYVMEVPTDIDGMLINGIKNDGTGTLDRTPDITSGWYDGICYYLYWEDGGNKVGSFNIADVEFACKHVEETVPGYAATCTETGLTDGVKCSVCDEILVAQEEIPALGHGHTEGISYEEGDGTHDVFCDDCYTTIEWNVECTYAEDTHACVCGNVETFTIEWYDAGTFKSETYKYGETVIGPEPVSEVTEQGKNTFLFWYDLNDGSKVTLPMTMPAKNLQLQAAYSYTGWAGVIGSDYYTYWIDSMEVQGWFNVNENNEPVGEGEGTRYYAGEDYNVVNTITLIDGVYYAFDPDTGAFLSDYTGVYEARNGDLYYVENGIAIENKGLVKTTDDNGHIHYYYFGCGIENCSAGDACQGEYKAQKSNRHYAQITNDLLVPGTYTIGEDGVIEHIDDTSVTGIYEIDGVKYYLMDGVKAPKGLVEIDGKFYYARSSGALVIGQDYWVSKTNGLSYNGEPIKAGSYTFGADGAIVFAEIKNGFYYEGDGWYYYVDDVKNYAGLIWCDGPEGNDPGYYYVTSKAKLITDCTYWISKNNGHMKNDAYCFDENGTMYTPIVEVKNGFYYETDGWYYYVDGARNYAGLIYCDGPEGNDPGYYYVNSKCKLITDCTYYISKNNGLMGNQNYTFDANGKMVQETGDTEELLSGFVEEDGEVYYYEDGIKTYAGLILVDGDYYYVNSKGKVIRDCTYWISKNNGYMSNGNYTFDAEGKMIQN